MTISNDDSIQGSGEKYQRVLTGLKFPEGPVFDFHGNLWFVEIHGGNLSVWNGKELVRYSVDGTPNGAMVDRWGKIWFCDSGRGEIRKYDPHEATFMTLCDSTTEGNRLRRPNDLIFDNAGNLLFSDHADGREEPVSTLCVLPAGGNKARVISGNKYFTNGLALMADGRTILFSETYRQQLWTGQWDPVNLKISGEKHFAKAGAGPWGPDGIAFDENERLFATVFNESKILIINKNGVTEGLIPIPGTRPTSCAFDPSGKMGLVVTEAERGEILSFPGFGRGLRIFHG